MRLPKWLSAAAALFVCACAPKWYTPAEARLADADALHLAELALAEELKHPIAPADGKPHSFYVRIGERPAPSSLLARLNPPSRFRLRPDPIQHPKTGSCLQVDLARGSDGETVDVSIFYGHSHPHRIQMEAQQRTFGYRRQPTGWVLVYRPRLAP